MNRKFALSGAIGCLVFLIILCKKAGGQTSRIISGVVTNSAGERMPGVSVREKGHANGVVTDGNGFYKIALSTAADSLLYSCVGYISRTLPVKNDTVVDVAMQSKSGNLSAVMVIGYSTAKKITYAGSVATVGGDEIKKSGAVNLTNALAGRLPGLVSIAGDNAGAPGAGSNLTVRGMNTINDRNHSNKPLVIIDGVPRNVTYDGLEETDELSNLNPDDVESISVLKDATAAAVYGARAANGVILVTTKRGKSGKPVLGYSILTGIQQYTRMAKPVNAYDFAALYNEALENEGLEPYWSQSALQHFKDGDEPDKYPDTDWWKAALKSHGSQTRHNLSLSGGAESAKYYLSLGYADEKGFTSNNHYKRYNVRSNLDARVNKNLTVALDLNAVYSIQNQPARNNYEMFNDLFQTPAVVPNRFSNDPSKWGAVGNLSSAVNPVWSTSEDKTGYQRIGTTSLQGTLSAEQQLPFIKGLSVKGVASYNRNYGNTKTFSKNPRVFGDAATLYFKELNYDRLFLVEYANQYVTKTLEAHLRYNRTIDKHTWNGLFLYTQSQEEQQVLNGSRSGFISPQLDYLDFGDAKTAVNSGNIYQNARVGYVGRASYSYADRYMAEANFRYDASANFAPGHRWGFFPSLAAGWNVAEEPFFKRASALSFIDQLKLRISWGRLGNDKISSVFPFLDFFNSTMARPTFNNDAVFTLAPSALSNPGITWEKATTTNLGLDMSFWNGVLTLTADYFYKRTTDILAQPIATYPATFGAELPLMNAGIVSNRGFEIQLKHEYDLGKLHYSISPNVSFSRSILDYVPESQPNPVLARSGTTQDYYQFVDPTSGLERGAYIADGLFRTDEEAQKSPTPYNVPKSTVKAGDIRYKDLNGDGIIDQKDMRRIGHSPVPAITYAANITIGLKSFDLSILLQGTADVSEYLQSLPAWAFQGGNTVFNGNAFEQHLGRWSPDKTPEENAQVTYPRLFINNLNNKQRSTYWLTDASYLRIKNVVLGYTLPQRWLRPLSISHIRIYASALNLATWSKLTLYDPEIRSDGFGALVYPIQRSYNCGLEVKF
ncbi:TonB-dependent receptor [Chitinophaga sp. OAE865]|uniref:SusC/RagA family TonB-linked outer membrane protein n=1 Tax=Chitinophaga sp. OAE865 TaxID=2817898 RepID=UPI001AE3858C